MFLEGQYGDAPFSLKVVVPAKAGPFDLGEVVVRQKIYVDPITAQVTVVSDPVPTIVKGVPVRLQRLEVNVDKPGFMINPTSCAAKAIAGTLIGRRWPDGCGDQPLPGRRLRGAGAEARAGADAERQGADDRWQASGDHGDADAEAGAVEPQEGPGGAAAVAGAGYRQRQRAV